MTKPTGISGRTIGLIAASVLALVFIVVIWVSVSAAPTQRPGENFFPDQPGDIPTIDDSETGGAMLVTMVDKNDPTRVAGTLRADRFKPIGDGRRRLDNPESWIYLKDGRAIRVTADYATMLMPDPNQPPESGTLEGDIEIRTYARTPAPGQPAPDDASPEMIARFVEPVEFERRYLRLRSGGPFEITSAQLDFSGSDLTVLLNDLRDRVELIEVGQGKELVIHTGASQPASAKTDGAAPASQPQATPGDALAQADASASTADPVASSGDDAAESPTRYHVTLSDEVVASVAGSGRASADTLELWAALVDGRLPDDAIRRIGFAKASTPPSRPTPAPTPQDAPPTGAPANTQQPPAQGTDLRIVWSGPMLVRPIDNKVPVELMQDSLAMRLGGDADGGVRFEMPDRGFRGQAKEATYFATRAVAELDGEQTEAGVIRLAVDGSGDLLAQSLRADLTSGRVSIARRGQITSTPGGAAQPEKIATITWKNKAAFAFALSDEGQISDRIEHARFEGAVIAKQNGNSVGARTLDAAFNPTLAPESALTRLELVDGVLSSADHSLLSGKDLAIDFVPSTQGAGLDPVRVISQGQALARTSEAMIKAQRMETELTRDAQGRVVMRAASANGDVNYRGSDRTSASADSLTADGPAETINLTGPQAKVAQGGSSITGADITLNARRRSIQVKGPGAFEHDVALENAVAGAPVTGHVRARWDGSMHFDDALGSVICQQNVRVLSTPDAYTRDTLEASRAEIKLTPMPTTDAVDAAGARPQRELISARIFGRAEAGSPPQPAKIESRTYDQTNPEKAIGVIYLEGAQILADNRRQLLDVPAPGKLVILDRSSRDQAPQENEGGEDPRPLGAGGPGLTGFSWKSRMTLDRAQGTAMFQGQVGVDHKALTSGKLVKLSTDRLDARFELGQDQSGQNQPRSQPTRLLDATATGMVRFLHENRELLADEAIYDAITDSLFANSLQNRRVTLYDQAQPGPMSAKTMRWDLANDQIQINAPTPMRGTTNSPARQSPSTDNPGGG